MTKIFGEKTFSTAPSELHVKDIAERIKELTPSKLSSTNLPESSLLPSVTSTIRNITVASLEKSLNENFIYETPYPTLISELVKVNESSPNSIDIFFPSPEYLSECINIPFPILNVYKDYLNNLSQVKENQLGRFAVYER
ncbi:MAG: hypothetical protein WC967_09395 [Balneolaceae bacterium]